MSCYRTLSAIEALELAIEILACEGADRLYAGRMQALRRARDAHREQEMKDARRRDEIRALAARVHGARRCS